MSNNIPLSPEAIRWLASGDRGVSSNTIFTHITGVNALNSWPEGYPHHPCSPWCFRLCQLLLEQCPEIKANFDLMRTASPQWERLVEAWDDILIQFNRDAPDWRDPDSDWTAFKTYELIRKAIGR